MYKFFANDFTQDRWRKAALKNAFALLSKQRFEHAAAFFLLAGQLWDAIEVCLNRLHDLQLALVVTRMYEGDNGEVYNKLLKQNVLGITKTGSLNTDPSPDPFLRSMSLWMLQDYSGALETLVVDLKPGLETKSSNAAIFNFYFYLRSHPLLIRRVHPVKRGNSIQPSASVMDFTSKFHGQSLSGVGEQPLTPTERNLVFTTAYHHLNSGSPLLALIVLAKLPKSEDLGQSDEPAPPPSKSGSWGAGRPQRSPSFDAITSGLISVAGDLSNRDDVSQPISFLASEQVDSSLKLGAITEEEDFDWSKPVSMAIKEEEDDFDWSKPVSNQTLIEQDEFDWSKPVSSQLQFSDNEQDEEDGSKETLGTELEGGKTANTTDDDQKGDSNSKPSKQPISARGLFIVSLAEQLQYNALLSILTEELITIHIPSCYKYLWESRGKDSLPLLPLDNNSSGRGSMVEWFEDEAFERSLVNLQSTIVEWLRSETQIVKEVCGMEVGQHGRCVISSRQAAHAGYDLLTTLLNYTSLHAGTTPSMLALKTELMHLMNTLLPWSTGLVQGLEDVDSDVGKAASCAVNPAQLPLLTSCSLPAKHPLNLSLHMKLLSANIFDCLSGHTLPPNVSNPLVQMDRVFELCVSLSHCISLCLSPMRLQTKRPSRSDLLDSAHSPASSPSGKRRANSGADILESIPLLDPKSRPSKWPGLPNWPNSLLSDDGKEPSPLCLILMEALVVVYTGLLAVAWSKHSVYDLLILLANIPSHDRWAVLFGGGVIEQKKASGSLMHTYMKKMRRQEKKGEESKDGGLYVAPKKSLLRHCLTKVRKK